MRSSEPEVTASPYYCGSGPVAHTDRHRSAKTAGVHFSLPELAEALGGAVHDANSSDLTVDGAAIDSRGEVEGTLFVPLVAERDGHDFVAAAAAAGAAAYLSDRGPLDGVTVPCVQVADTTEALSALGARARSRMAGPVVGITGSVGKTSVKDLTLAACQAGGPAFASTASFNNEIGVPLTLANGPSSTTQDPGPQPVVIVEMGARGVGHIAELCRLARPSIGVVTRVALVHSELFGSIEAVAQGKGELIESLPADGTAVLNADDPLVAAMAARTTASVITYGQAATADMRRGPVALDGDLRPRFTVTSSWGTAELTLAARGAHMADNALAALASAVAAGVAFDDAVVGVQRGGISQWRMQLATTPTGATVLNDAYNANPTSMRAALDALGSLQAERRIAVLGVMKELGSESEEEHRAVANEAAAAGIRVIAIDAEQYGPAAEHVADTAAAMAALGSLSDGDAVLLKGSRAAGLETLASALLE
jgi:UDP-N-acetylmuramoyl-tripeptide--D-alanyl-D-alanine ligase